MGKKFLSPNTTLLNLKVSITNSFGTTSIFWK